jgi:Phage capsid family
LEDRKRLTVLRDRGDGQMMPGMMERLPTDTAAFQRLQTRELMRWLSSLAQHAGGGLPAREYYEGRWGPRQGNSSASLVLSVLDGLDTKAAIAPGSSTDATWASPLVPSQISTAFLTQIRKASVIGKLDVLRVPFNVQMTVLQSGSSTAWMGEGKVKPISKMSFANQAALAVTKCSSIIVLTKELMKFSEDGSEEALQQILLNEVVTFTDAAFLGTAAATATSPAGLLNGVTASASLDATISAFFTSRPNAASPTWVIAPAKLGALTADLNVPQTYKGYPIVQTPAAGPHAILLDPRGIAVADGGIVLDVSNEAAIQMDGAPTDPPVAATVYASLFQLDLSAVRAERTVNWTKETNAVAYTVLP